VRDHIVVGSSFSGAKSDGADGLVLCGALISRSRTVAPRAHTDLDPGGLHGAAALRSA
jgi:hypothetical protein